MDTLRTVIYARVSVADEQESENQLLILRKVCAGDPQLDLGDEYIDEESGGTPERAAFRRLFDDAYQRKFDLVLFWSLDRFSREGALETLNHLRELERYGVGFRSHTERFLDSTGHFKDAIIAILATLAKQERIRMSERTKAGMARAAAQGKRAGRPALDDKTRARIAALAKKGKSKAAIARQLRIGRATVQRYLASAAT